MFIPILPTSLIEVLSTPTPFIMGVHSVHEREIQEVLDTIVVDLDGGALTLPENYKIYMVQDTLLNKTRQELSLVLNPDLNVADHAFQRMGKKHALKIYDRFTLNTSCFGVKYHICAISRNFYYKNNE